MLGVIRVLALQALVGSCALLLACAGTPRAAAPAAPAAPAASAPVAQAATAAPTKPPPLTHVTAGFGSLTALYVPLWIAGDEKLFEKYGLDVELVSLPGNTGPQSLVAGKVPIVGLSGYAAAPSMVEGADLVMLTQNVRRQTAQIFAVPAITSPQAMRGKRMGITRPGTLTHFGALLALREWGLKPDQDVTFVSLNESAAILTGMLSGAADAGVLTDPNNFAAANQGLHLLTDLADVPTEYITTGVTTTHAYAAQHRDVLLNFIRGYSEGLKRFYEDRALAEDTLRRYVQIDDPEVLDKTYTLYTEKYFVKVPRPDVEGMQNILNDYAGVDPHARDVDAKQLVDPSFVEQLQNEGFYRSLGFE